MISFTFSFRQQSFSKLGASRLSFYLFSFNKYTTFNSCYSHFILSCPESSVSSHTNGTWCFWHVRRRCCLARAINAAPVAGPREHGSPETLVAFRRALRGTHGKRVLRSARTRPFFHLSLCRCAFVPFISSLAMTHWFFPIKILHHHLNSSSTKSPHTSYRVHSLIATSEQDLHFSNHQFITRRCASSE